MQCYVCLPFWNHRSIIFSHTNHHIFVKMVQKCDNPTLLFIYWNDYLYDEKEHAYKVTGSIPDSFRRFAEWNRRSLCVNLSIWTIDILTTVPLQVKM